MEENVREFCTKITHNWKNRKQINDMNNGNNY